MHTVAEIAQRAPAIDAAVARAFDDAGLTGQLRLTDHGTWIPLAA